MTRPAHDCMLKDFEDHSFRVKLHEAVHNKTLPPSYDDHPVVTSSDELVVPVGIYMDSLPYSLVDSVLGVWLINYITGARHILMLIRKRSVCACGCRGWCTYHNILVWINWCAEILAAGIHPSSRHDGEPFLEFHDEARIDLAGAAMRFKCAVIKLKGDWQEFAERLGFPTWQSGTRPCFCCNGFGSLLYSPIGVSFSSALPWDLNTDEDYHTACQRCEIWIIIPNADDLGRIVQALHYDKRKTGNRGRCLKLSFLEFSLDEGDRLEPHSGLMDIAEFDAITTFPAQALFWRRSNETLCTHRSPLFNYRIGITPTKSIAIDALHTLFLGPMLVWGKLALWCLLLAGIWGTFESNNEERLRVAIMAMRAALMHWYSQEQAQGRFHTRIDYMTSKMIGTQSKQALKLKAMEAYGFIQFLVHCLLTYPSPNTHALRAAGQLLIQFVQIMKDSHGRLTVAEQHRMLSMWKQYMAIMRPYESDTPKAHLAYHMILRTPVHGNPWMDHTFLDESLNKQLKQCCRMSHQVTFEQSVICKLQEILNRLMHKRGLH